METPRSPDSIPENQHADYLVRKVASTLAYMCRLSVLLADSELPSTARLALREATYLLDSVPAHDVYFWLHNSLEFFRDSEAYVHLVKNKHRLKAAKNELLDSQLSCDFGQTLKSFVGKATSPRPSF